ncbi:MAG: 1-acyl-sn-glycerol-3-phosphate acyltransferase [Planctomycetes bacterium]|nr:1-acyl-sn-glycerol-3-phosphate acyltransferase [Planctomycetota bacterium]
MFRLFFAHLRAIVRLSLAFVSLIILVISWTVPPLVRVFSRRQADRLLLHQLGVWSRCSLAIIGVKVESSGPTPSAPYLLTCNHLSYLDVMVLWSQVDAFFLGKSELAKWPAMGPLIRAAGTVFIDRTMRSGVVAAIEKVTDKVNEGNGVIFFPEGTSSSGGEIRTYKSNMFQVAAHAQLPVHVAVIHYSTNNKHYSAINDIAWWGDMTFVPHYYKMLMFDNKVARLKFSGQTIACGDRKQMAQQAQHLATEAFEPMHDFEDIEPGSDVSFLA